jgi:D-alanyl-D-alanine dipeptidase
MGGGRRTAIILAALFAALALAALVRGAWLPPAPGPSPAPTAAPEPSPGPSAAPTATPAATSGDAPRPLAADGFELPVNGASGYAAAPLYLREKPEAGSRAVAHLAAGAAFTVIDTSDGWIRARTGTAEGWADERYCLVNLPDVAPSVVYDATNAYASVVRSSGVALPGGTGKALYPGKRENLRLGEAQFIMPVLYSMAKKVCAAQKMALENGETLVLCEAYRPYDVQMTIVRALKGLAEDNPAVMKGISSAPWHLSWFASTRLSNHQRGGAIDVSLAKAVRTVQAASGGYGYTRVTKIEPYEMPTPIQELSQASAAFSQPVSSGSRTAWRKAEPAPAMNEAALRLQRYCTEAGLTPLASEWWHFNDLDALEAAGDNPGAGRFTLSECVSAPPGA